VTAAIIVTYAGRFIEARGIDDPVGAISVHGIGGLYGVICVGLFADGTYGTAWNALDRQWTKDNGVTGLFYGGEGAKQLLAQLIGCGILVTVILGLAYAFFSIQNKVTKGGIRSDEADEIAGVDMGEMGVLAYPEFELAK
jgi:ammonium transporter, Amt family